jgi:DNA-binding transcriptional LysR family regulator
MENPFDGMTMFTRVVEAGSFSRAAADLGIAKSSISQAVRRLEARLGIRLLNRTTRRVVPTEAGHRYYAHARKALDEADAAAAEAAALQAAPVGTLRIASPEVFTRMHIVPLLPDFVKACPGLQLDFVEGVPLVDLLEARVDLAIRVSRDTADTLIVRRLATSHVVVVASPDYLAGHRAPERPEDVAEHRTIGFSPLCWGHEWRFERDGEAVSVPIQPILRTDAAETLRSAALCGVGLTALPDWMVAKEIAAGELVQLLPSWKTAESGIYTVYPSNRLMAAKVKAFADFVAVRIRRLAAAQWRTAG